MNWKTEDTKDGTHGLVRACAIDSTQWWASILWFLLMAIFEVWKCNWQICTLLWQDYAWETNAPWSCRVGPHETCILLFCGNTGLQNAQLLLHNWFLLCKSPTQPPHHNKCMLEVCGERQHCVEPMAICVHGHGPKQSAPISFGIVCTLPTNPGECSHRNYVNR